MTDKKSIKLEMVRLASLVTRELTDSLGHRPTGKYIKFWYQKSKTDTHGASCKNGLYYSGLTICVVDWGEEKTIGVSFCKAGDKFNKQKGRLIALGRAVYQNMDRKNATRIHNPPNFLYSLGAPWRLWFDERPDPRWPDGQVIAYDNVVAEVALASNREERPQ